jgi:hypothetical protein
MAMTVRAIKEWPDGHPIKNGMIGFVKSRITSSENQSPVAKKIVTLREQEDGIKIVKPRNNKD